MDARRPRESLCGAGCAGRDRPGDQGLRPRQPARCSRCAPVRDRPRTLRAGAAPERSAADRRRSGPEPGAARGQAQHPAGRPGVPGDPGARPDPHRPGTCRLGAGDRQPRCREAEPGARARGVGRGRYRHQPRPARRGLRDRRASGDGGGGQQILLRRGLFRRDQAARHPGRRQGRGHVDGHAPADRRARRKLR
jgi:hypothetical protein